MSPWLKEALGPKYLLSWLIGLWCGMFAILALTVPQDDPSVETIDIAIWAGVLLIMGAAGAFATAFTNRAATGGVPMRAAVLGCLGLFAAGSVLTLPSGIIGIVNMILAVFAAVRYIRAMRTAAREAKPADLREG